MGSPKPEFRRMIVGLPRSPRDYGAVSVTAEFANIFGTHLVGTFYEERRLLEFAALPAAREFRHGSWHPLSVDRLERELSALAREAELSFLAVVSRCRAAASFTRGKDPAEETIFADAGADDIIAIIEPKSPLERVTHQFTQLVAAAFKASSSILLVPDRPLPAAGPIVVVADDGSDPALDVALAISAATGDPLIVIPARHTDTVLTSIQTRLQQSVAAGTLLTSPVLELNTLMSGRLPSASPARLLIAKRPAGADDLMLAAKVPVLLVSTRERPKAERAHRQD